MYALKEKFLEYEDKFFSLRRESKLKYHLIWFGLSVVLIIASIFIFRGIGLSTGVAMFFVGYLFGLFTHYTRTKEKEYDEAE